MYGAAEGLPVAARSLVIGPDGTAWAMTTDQLYRLDGSRWSPMGSQLAFDSNNWIVATPDNGVALPGASGIVIFDGTEWIKTGVAPPPMAAVVTGRVDPHVLGYDSDGDLVDVSFADGSVSVRTASRGANSGSSPSNISVSLTVDVDSQGNAWYGTIEGAWRFEGDTAELIEVGEPGDCCAPLAVDANDNVWIHLTTDTDTGVLVRLSPGGEITRFTAEDGIPFLADFGAIVPTADGTVWLLEHGGGGVGRVAHFNGSGWNSYTASDAREAGLPTMPSGSNFGIVDGPDGSTWTIELYQETEPVLHRFFDGEWRAVPNAGISTSPVFGGYGTQGIAIGPDGSLWIPTSTGVARFQPNGE
jgi:streptogramin lyase